MALLAVAGVSPVQAQSRSPGDDLFLDVAVQARFFRPGQSSPTVVVRTQSPIRLDCVVYDRTDRPVACYSADQLTNQFQLALAHLPSVARGVYTFGLAARNEKGEIIGVYPHSPGGGEIITVKESALDTDKKQITYVLPKAACVRLRAGLREGLYLSPIISALAQPAGPHSVAWDGSCQGGAFTNLFDNPQVRVNILAVSLPANILVDESAMESNRPEPAPKTATLPPHLVAMARPPWRQGPAAEIGGAASYLIADDYNLGLEVKQDTTHRTADVLVDCGHDERGRLFSKRFELMLFLDAAFLMEDERSQLPFSYSLSTRGLVPGKHIVTANVIDSDGGVGTRSREFVLNKP